MALPLPITEAQFKRLCNYIDTTLAFKDLSGITPSVTMGLSEMTVLALAEQFDLTIVRSFHSSHRGGNLVNVTIQGRLSALDTNGRMTDLFLFTGVVAQDVPVQEVGQYL